MAKFMRTPDGFNCLPGSIIKKVEEDKRHYELQCKLKAAGHLEEHPSNPNALLVIKTIRLGNGICNIIRFVIGRECEGHSMLKHFNTGLDYDTYRSKYENVERKKRQPRQPISNNDISGEFEQDIWGEEQEEQGELKFEEEKTKESS
jgi:hypothetical protein